MKLKKGDRRRFLKRGAAMAGVALGALRPASGQRSSAMNPDSISPGKHLPYGLRSRFETTQRDYSKGGGQYQMSGSAGTPLEDLHGIITPSPLHFVISHGATPPDFDPKEHRVLIQGMVDRPLIFTLEELKRLPSISRICFIECGGNSSYFLSSGRYHNGTGPRTPMEAHGRTSCSEWTGVLLSLLLREAGMQNGARWLIGEGAEGGWTISIPLESSSEVMVVYGQNGEAIRPEQGYPLRLVCPGFPGDHSVKWLRRVLVTDRPYMSDRDESQAQLRPDGKNRLFKPQMPPKSVITYPAGGLQLPGPGFYEITGLAWSGKGVVTRLEVSTNGGRSWKDARLQDPVLPKAHTRFCLDWNWNGQETVLQSRCTDETGEVQPTIDEMGKVWGATKEEWRENFRTPTLFNPIQPWRVNRDGTIDNALFS
jgi:sulfane dehydrogenase subunit SoxC